MTSAAAYAELAAALAAELQPWFVRSQRPLAWRSTRDPYGIWVSEIMLQQTRVQTVERYWEPFMRRFPDVGTLAAADEDAVLQSWSGLGYYRRARLLHQGARYVMEALGGRFPRDAAALRAVPGIGRYTAGAVAAIAYDQPAPLVDGNVARVFTRVRGLLEPKAQGADAPEHWALAEAVVREGSPRLLAQALMELGATVCTPKSPRCSACPVAARCAARAEGLQEQIPAVRKKIEQPVERLTALAVVVRRRVLLVRRPAEGLLGGLWCLPLAAGGPAAVRAEATRIFGDAALSFAPVAGLVRHVFTHRIWELELVVARPSRRPPLCPDLQVAWSPLDEAPPGGGMPSVTKKLLARLLPAASG